MPQYRIVSTPGNATEIECIQNLFRTTFQRLLSDDINTLELRNLLETLALDSEKITTKKFPDFRQHPINYLNQCFETLNNTLDNTLSKAQFADTLSYPTASRIYGIRRVISRITAFEQKQENSEKTDRSVAEAIIRMIDGHKDAAILFHGSYDVLKTLTTAAERATEPTTITAIATALGRLILVDREPLAGQTLITEATRNTLLTLGEKATTDTERAAISIAFQNGLPEHSQHNAFTHESLHKSVKKMLTKLAQDSVEITTQKTILASLKAFMDVAMYPNPNDKKTIIELLTHLDKKNSQSLRSLFPSLPPIGTEK